MHIPRVYLNQKLFENSTIDLPKETAIHLVTVLKRRVGDKIILFNNQSSLCSLCSQEELLGEYHAEIVVSKKNSVIVKVLEYTAKNTKSKVTLELAQCISKAQHFDVTLQKAVELGVNIITPIISERSERIIKFDRWQRIVISACEQSGRTDLPILNQPIELITWCGNASNLDANETYLLALCTKTKNNISNLCADLTHKTHIKTLIGSEGGLADSEINYLLKNNFNLVNLGNRILRTETAGIAIISILQFVTQGF